MVAPPLAYEDDDYDKGRMAIGLQAQVAVAVYPNGAIAIQCPLLLLPAVHTRLQPHTVVFLVVSLHAQVIKPYNGSHSGISLISHSPTLPSGMNIGLYSQGGALPRFISRQNKTGARIGDGTIRRKRPL
ncbi:hypothetical protein RHMOL_Rhmol07G0293600 [Rhododendron molle]|uniref:Uncharacterized protein n=1 Tax=Rhododendron molle TaxID=49168 RepID=A0ACC0N5Z3_RHOML|nr:hypothetical protein RHMOL_Rhmol07G0293600 [Rhododendron molle]